MTVSSRWFVSLLVLVSASAFITPPTPRSHRRQDLVMVPLFSSNNNDDELGKKIGGYTVKQRLREEVESPFRKVRLLFFGSSAGSALTALYFSATNALKATMGGYENGPSLNEALTSSAINLAAAVVCGFLAFREYKAGQANLERIAKGGALARLRVQTSSGERNTLGDYRRAARVLLAVGGQAYVNELARSLNADQLADTNTIPERIAEDDVVVVPVLLQQGSVSGMLQVGDTQSCWSNTVPKETDRHFNLERSKDVISFPMASADWTEYLKSEIETAQSQGFDVLEKGFTIVVKKNGRILRRATGQPQWANFLGAMEVLDGSKFGMPGDSERYGGP